MKVILILFIWLLITVNCSKIFAQEASLEVLTGEPNVFSMSLSPDGKTLATAGTRLQIWNLETGTNITNINLSERVLSVAFSPDGKFLAVGGLNGLHLLEFPSGKESRVFEDHQPVLSICFNHDGHQLATGDINGGIKIRDVATGTMTFSYSVPNTTEVLFPSFSPNGKYFAFSVIKNEEKDDESWKFVLLDLAKKETIKIIDYEEGFIGTAKFSPDGKNVAIGNKKHVQILSLSDGSITEIEESGFSVAYSPDAAEIAISDEYDLKIWNVAEQKITAEFEDIEEGLIQYTADGKKIVYLTPGGAIKVLDVAGKTVSQKFGGNVKGVKFTQFNLEDKTLTVKNDNDDYSFWDLQAGRKIQNVNSNIFSPKRKWRVECCENNQIKILDVNSGKSAFSLVSPAFDGNFKSHSTMMDFSQDESTAAVGRCDGTVLLIDLDSGGENNLGKVFHESGCYQPSVKFSPDGKNLAVRQILGEVNIYDTAKKQEIQLVEPAVFKQFKFSADSQYLAGLTSKNSIEILDLKTGKKARSIGADAVKIKDFELSPDNQTLAIYDEEKTLKLWDFQTGKELKTFAVSGENYLFSKNGRIFLGYDTKTRLWRIWDTKKNEELFSNFGIYRISATNDNSVFAFCFSEKLSQPLLETMSWKEIVEKTAADTIQIFDAGNGKIKRTLSSPNQKLIPEIFSKDGTKLSVVNSAEIDSTRTMWNLSTGAVLWSIPNKEVSSRNDWEFSQNGKFIAEANDDGYVRFRSAETGKIIANLLEIGEADWAVFSPDGRFDGSPGAFKFMQWRYGEEIIAFEQLQERFYEPGLLGKLLGFNPEKLRDLSANAKKVTLFPAFQFEQPNAKQSKIEINLKNRGGGIGRVQIFVNGKEFLADARDKKLTENSKTTLAAQIKIDLAKAPTFRKNERNEVRVVTWNADDYLSSPRGSEFVNIADEIAPDAQLYAIIGGVSDYAAADLKLHFAAKDAEDIYQSLQIGGKNLFGVEKVHLTLLATGNNKNAVAPTKENFLKAFADVAQKAKAGDIFLIYLSGHGISLDYGSDTYLFLTQEAQTADKSKLADPVLRNQTTLSIDELTELIKQVPALKQVMVLDTCAAGSVAGKFTQKQGKGLSGDAIRALNRMKNRTGFQILLGSAANAPSYEASQFGQGLLTYSLLEGMRGAALASGGRIDVQKLFQYATDRVPQLAGNIGGIQQPRPIVPFGGASFDIGLIKSDEDKKQIPLTLVKPQILSPDFRNKETEYDNLQITTVFEEKLRESSFTELRGESADFVYLETRDFVPEAFKPVGTYSIERDKIKFKIRLVKNNAVVTEINLESDKNKYTELIDKAISVITAEANKHL